MYKSDIAVGMFYPEAVRYIERNDLWEEVIDLVTDSYGIVTKVIH